MNFRATHTFMGIDLPAFERLFFDEPFNEAMCQQVRIARQVEARHVKGDALTRTTLLHPDRQVPGPIAKLIGNTKIGYREHLEYNFVRHEGVFRCEATVMTDRVSTEGALCITQEGEGIVRHVTGEVRVRVFGVGSVIERFIVADVEKSYEDAATFTADYLRTHGAP